MPYLTCGTDGTALLSLYIQPRASRNMISGVHDGSLKISITTPPVDGKANSAVTAFLAKTFKVAKRDVQLRSGHTSRRKTIAISGITEEEIRGYIESVLKK
ncbi:MULTISPECIES: DUF167 domain-containing protein [Desulfosediminicola]|uniref:DUF167 domain-containing protein n=1 Tax=Desulfosediminicola TaxID=2886823 RepID=UPI0010ABE25F|nr:DUF167 family protein [Desulfosediminicola ganghwensis]